MGKATLRDNRAKIAVLRRVDRAALGNFGDHKAFALALLSRFSAQGLIPFLMLSL